MYSGLARASIFILIFTIAAAFLVNEGKAQTSQQVNKNVTIYKKQGVYAAFPQIYRMPRQDICLTFNAQTAHVGFTHDTQKYISRDHGVTWHETNECVADPMFKFNNGYFIPKAKGWQTVSKKEGVIKQKEGYEVKFIDNEKAIYTEGAAYVSYSTDGIIWKSRNLQLPKFKLLMGYNYSAYLRLGDKAMVSVFYGKLTDDNADRPFILSTNDGGEHWDFSPMFQDKADKYSETAIALNKNGDVVALLRAADDRDGTDFLYLSLKIKGKSLWTKPVKTSLRGTSPNLITLSSGKMVATYAYRSKPMGIRACVSLDGGRTWDKQNEHILRSDAVVKMIGDVGYPMTVELEDDSLLSVYYITLEDGLTQIAATKWKL